MSILIGDRVRYSAQFCRSIGMYAGPRPNAVGTVVQITNLGATAICEIQWDEALPPKVNAANLSKVTKKFVPFD